MSIESSGVVQNRAVRVAVSLFFFICVPLSVWESNVHSSIFVPQDPVSTVRQLLENEFSFRTTLISHIIGTTAFITLAWLFYRVFSGVNKALALLMLIPIVTQFPIVFIMEAVNFTALMTAKLEPRVSFNATQQQEVAYFLLRLYRFNFGADKIVFGLFFIPLGILFLRSQLAPRVVAILLILGGTGYVLDTSLYYLLQRADYATVQSMKLFASASYSLGFIWLLVKGIDLRKVNTA
jgi:hypothetical protein